MDRKEAVAEWFRFADMDLDLAKHTLETMHPAPLEIICYHCQQGAEKYLKGVLIHFGIEPEKTHDLQKLVDVLKTQTDIPPHIEDYAETLSLYGVRTRYPAAISVDEEQTRAAIAHAEKVKQWAESVIAQTEKPEQAEKENPPQ